MAIKDKTKLTKLQQKAAAIAACKDKKGRVRPEYVIEAAKNKTNILHGEFEWDQSKGHMIYLMDRAKELIREVKFVVTYQDIKLAAPFYVSDVTDLGSSYIETTEIKRKSVKAKEVLADEMARVKASLRRAHTMAIHFGLDDLWEEMTNLIVEIEKRLGETSS